MKKLISTLFLLFTLITASYPQQQDSSLKQIKDKELSFDILLGISTYTSTMNYLQFDAGYYIFRNSELGISVGKDYPYEIMYGFYFSQHYDEEVQTGLRVEFIGEDESESQLIYTEIFIGRDFLITNRFSLRMNIFYSFVSEVPLGLNGHFGVKKLGFQAGVSYLF
ncbi:MAG: hypothetical protein L0Y76_10845 [Ignavibacteria bacterium]|nr:hypothetical protein [Ignavibacteria bacterium]